jgi:hypothetical protein
VERLRAAQVNLVALFSPEHGFRGTGGPGRGRLVNEGFGHRATNLQPLRPNFFPYRHDAGRN